MVRSGLWVALALWCVVVDSAVAQSPADRTVAQTLRVQQALNRARSLLGEQQADQAIVILEAELPHIDGNSNYLALLRTAYVTHLKELQLANDNPARIAELKDRLQKLDATGSASLQRTPPPVPTAPEPEMLTSMAPPPEPDAPMPSPPEPDAPMAPPPAPTPMAEVTDPFQQTPLEMNMVDRTELDSALDLFDQKQYSDALGLFAKANQKQVPFSESELRAWAYCRLSAVVARLNAPGKPPLSELEAEVRDAMAMAPLTPSMRDFAENRVLAEIQKRRGSMPASPKAPAGWMTFESDNFRVLYRQDRASAEAVARAAESSRKITFEKWSGPVSSWSIRCDIYLHESASAFGQGTGKPGTLPGVAKVSQRGKEVLSRRIDLRLDDPNHLAQTLPHQLAYVIQVDLFGEQTVPRWAGEAMAVLSEPPGQVARYLRFLPRCQEQGQFIHLAQLMSSMDLPSAEVATPYFVESVSVVDYLVRLKGSKAFTLFLLDGERYGYEKSLNRQYGIRDFNELEQKWLQHTSVAAFSP